MNKTIKFLTTLLLLAVSVGAWADDTYVKVTSTDDLVAGAEYLLVNENNDETSRYHYVMGSISNTSTKYGTKVDVAKPEISGTLVIGTSDNVNVLTLGGETDKWTFKTSKENAYLYWSSGNSLATATTVSNKSQWKVSFSGTTLDISNVGTTTRHIKYNISSPRFACYESGQSSVCLYKKQENSNKPATPTFSPTIGTTFGNDGLDVTISQSENKPVYYNINSDEDPTSSSTLYTGSIHITETSTIKAVALDGTEYSNVATATYTYVDPNAPGTQNNPYTVADARAAIDAGSGTSNVYATGIVSEIPTAYSTQYSNITFNFVDEEGDTEFLQAYRCVGDEAANVQVGDIVVVYGNLTKYNSTYEFGSGCQLVSLTHPAAAVETPTFNPEAGTYAEAQNVTISCATNGATIYYTTDGTDPTTSSTQYTEAIAVSQTMTIKAIAVNGNDESSVAAATYHINSQDNPYTVAQALAFNEYPANNIYVHGIVSTAPISLNNDGTLTYYISDNGEATNELEVYKGKNLENVVFDAVDDIQVGDIVTIYGNVKIYNGTKEFENGNYLVSFERPASTEPSISVANNNINVTAEGGEGTINVTYENISEVAAEIAFFEEDGTTAATYDWITAEINDNNNIEYLINANDGEARSAYMKVWAYDDDLQVVYSELITITQAAPVIDYATLPFEYDGDATETLPSGLTQDGLGTKTYSSSPKMGFDTTGDYLLLKINEAPGTLTYDIKGNNFSGGTFKVQTSTDGETYTDLQSYTTLGSSTQSESFENLAADVRYIKWIYTNKSSGNVALGNIKLEKYVEPSHDPVITLDPLTVNVGAAGDEGTIAISYNNFGLLDVGDFDIQYYDAEGVEILEPDWIDSHVEQPQGGDFVVSYVVEANDGAARTAYFKVYTMDGNENLVYSKLVTITQAAAPVIYTTIPDLFAAATSTSTPVNVTFGNWVVTGVNGNQLFVTDGTYGFIVYQSDHGFKVGNVLSGTASCNLVLFGGSAELTGLTSTTSGLTVETGGSVTPVATTIGDLGAVNTGSVVTLSNLTYDGSNLSDGTNTIIPWTTLYNGTFDNGKTYNVTGVFVLNNDNKRILPRSAEDIEEIVIPVITVDPSTVNVDAAGGEDTLPISFENLDITGITGFDIQYYDDAEGNAAIDKPYWIDVEVIDEQYDNYVVSYSIAANEGEARTAYFKVIAEGARTVYSNLVTITQASSTSESYELFTGDLVEGDYLIVYEGKAMNTTVTSDRLQYADVTAINGVITTDDASIVWHIAPSGEYWTIYNADADAYAASTGAKNKAQMLADGTDNKALWTVSGTETYEFVNKQNAANSVNANLRNNGDYGFACYATSTGGELSLYKKVEATPTQAVNISSAGMATFCSENALDFTGLTDMYAYIALYNNDKVTYRKVTKVPARTGVLLRNPNGGATSQKVPVLTGAADDVEGNKFIGTLTEISSLPSVDGDNTNYILNNGVNGVGFYKAAGKKVGAGKAYLQIPTPADGKKVFIGFEETGEATGIENVNRETTTNGRCYNLNGQQVSGNYKGIVIVNGKKTIVK